jgi:hypothetical protein
LCAVEPPPGPHDLVHRRLDLFADRDAGVDEDRLSACRRNLLGDALVTLGYVVRASPFAPSRANAIEVALPIPDPPLAINATLSLRLDAISLVSHPLHPSCVRFNQRADGFRLRPGASKFAGAVPHCKEKFS